MKEGVKQIRKNRRAGWRYRMIYRIMHLISPLLLKKYDFSTDVLKDFEGPYIVMANHLTEVDMFMLMAAFPKHMFFVAGEHLTRSKHGRLITWAQSPIYEYKGSVALDTVREVLEKIKGGNNVMIFPEGSRSFNGETPALPESAAKLLKIAGCGLVTYRIEGGYFVAPRWAYTFRTGPMRGRITGKYSPAEIAAMTPGELTEAINRGVYENAYVRQRKDRLKYRGERLAEGLENYLVRCPACGAFDSMETKDDSFRCTACGQAGVYTEEGFLEGEGLRFDSVYDWGMWAEKETEQYVDGADPDRPVFRDSGLLLYEVTPDHKQHDLAEGDLTGYKDRLEFGNRTFFFGGIPAMDMLYYGKSLLFTYEKRHLGLTGENFHAIKYHKLYKQYKKK